MRIPVLSVLFLSACGPKREPPPQPSDRCVVVAALDGRFAGEWVTETSTALWVIDGLDGGTRWQLSGLDRSDGEAFEISDCGGGGEVLTFQSRMPSTGFTLQHRWTLAEADTIRAELSGDFSGTLVMERR